jgi:hypothetical protein
MGLFDSLTGGLKNALEQVETAALPTLISAGLAKTSLGNMQATAKTCRSRLTNFVQDWAARRSNS